MPATTTPAAAPRRNVLPKCVTPREYHLHVTPNFSDFSFAGSVRIRVAASACCSDDGVAHPDSCGADGAIKAIKLNAIELAFGKVTVTHAGTGAAEEVPASSVAYDEKNMTATIPLVTTVLLPGDEADVAIEYRGTMNDRLVGFYRSRYTNSKGEAAYMGTTQFEAVDARRALPCWDEPAAKAVFHVTITAPTGLTTLSNMHVVESHADAGGETTTHVFAPTPRMSSYLLAWVIAELESISQTIRLPLTPDMDTVVSVYTVPGVSEKGRFALDIATRVLPLYDNFFETVHPLKKIDMVAIPDFAAGAMENWGLITYRESAILCDSSTTTIEKKYIALVVSHELSHHISGNLVTMSWWNELWLNEAFATYVEYYAVEKLLPEWDIFSEMLQREGGQAMKLDALHSSHPVEVDICDAEDIDSIFDAISYSKGCSLIRMIVEFIGETAFQKGMAAYVKHFQYRNANTIDLWHFLGEAAGRDVAGVMADWTGTQGYPYLHVAAAADGVAVTQHRFLATREPACDAPSHWSIPLLVAAQGVAEEAPVVIAPGVADGSPQVVSLPSAAAPGGWVKVNSRHCAFCRVLYSDEMLARLRPALGKMGCLDRLGVVGDYAAFAKGGYAPTTTVLEILNSLAATEDNLSVWTSISETEMAIRRIVSTKGAAALDSFNGYCRSLYGPAMGHLGFTPRDGEAENDDQLRSLLFGRLIAAGDKKTLEAARALYAAGAAAAAIPQNLLRVVYSVRVREGGAEALAEVKHLADTVAQLSDRHKYLACISAACPETASVSDIFDYCFAPGTTVRPGEVLYVLSGIVGKPELVASYAAEVRARWARIAAVLPPMLLSRVPKLIEYGAEAAIVTDMRAFLEGLSEVDRASVGRNVEQALEELDTNVQWAARDADAVVEWLNA